MRFFEKIEPEDFWKILQAVKLTLKEEEIYTKNSLGRVASQSIVAEEDLPGFLRSAVDGYATSSSFLKNKSLQILKILGEVRMGEPLDIYVKDGSCVWVPTGGVLPKGADCVIKFENVEKLGDKIIVKMPANKFENVISKDDDLKKGEIIVEKGEIINFSKIHALLSLGIWKISVYENLKIGIIPTGSELVEPFEDRKISQIREANSYTLETILKRLGYSVKKYRIVSDDQLELKRTFEKSLFENHITVVSGGSFLGKKDFTKKTVESIEGLRLLVYGIMMQPGKSLIFGDFGGKVIFGLPGKPQSFLLLSFSVLLPFLKILSGKVVSGVRAKLLEGLSKKKRMLSVVWARLEKDGVRPLNAKKNMYKVLTSANGYMILPKDCKCEKGKEVEFYFLEG